VSVYDDLPQHRRLDRAWRGVIAATVNDFSDKVYVTIPTLGNLRLGPCRWQSRDGVSFPARGDFCLVIFDNDNEPWVAVWWPF
jgi:hypothetical protein